MKKEIDSFFYTDRYQSIEIIGMIESFNVKKDDRNKLLNDIIDNLRFDKSLEQLPEWVILPSSEKKDISLLHFKEPIFLCKVFNSSNLGIAPIDSYVEAIKFYDEAKKIFMQLGCKFSPSSYIKTLQKRPPRHVKLYTATSNRALTKLIRNQISESSVFGIKCSCGNIKFNVYGQKIDGYEGLSDTIVLKCTECSNDIIIFDSRYHGYDGIVCGKQYDTKELNNNKGYMCNSCGNDIFEVSCGFEHSLDKDEAKEIIKERSLQVGTEDLFTWFIATTKCTACGSSAEISSIECS